ncbi:MAG: alpha/beta-type small acid-soluble spore protein [Bacillota bacterium]
MAQFFPYDKLLPDSVLDRFKYEVAAELGLSSQIADGYWGEVTAQDCGRVGGKIGGSMVRVMIRHAEEALRRGERL